MARIRTIKPEFWTHEELSVLPEATHMLAGALLNYADDEGYFNANPMLIKAACFPLREPSVKIPESLRSLQTMGYIELGIAPDGKRYGRVVHFLTHQKVSHPAKSKIKDIQIVWESSGDPPESLRNPLESLRPELNREQGIEQGKNILSDRSDDTGSNRPQPRPVLNGSRRFPEFWSAYPKKVKKAEALKRWRQRHLDDKADEILADISIRMESDRRWKDGFIPDPTTYINGERWNDEVSDFKPQQPVAPHWKGAL